LLDAQSEKNIVINKMLNDWELGSTQKNICAQKLLPQIGNYAKVGAIFQRNPIL
jgi:hypothetical protein